MANLSQRLRHGKALCARVFAGFVDTFNALVDFKDNLKGDDDVVRGVGRIRVDRADPAHPIIRCTGCSAGQGDDSTTDPDDSENPEEEECVTSLNELTGDLTIIGGKGIRVEITGKVIKISYDPDKDYEDDIPDNSEEEDDPCQHPGSGESGGVSPEDDDEDHGGSSSDTDGVGGVSADGDEHEGDPCNGPNC